MIVEWLRAKLPIISFVAALLMFAVPVMSDHSPSEFFKNLKPWLPAFYALGVALFLYGFGDFWYHRGRASKELNNELPIVITPAKGRTIKDLIYAANQIASILLEQGALRVGALEAKYPTLERDHDAWHDDEACVARDDLMSLARFCCNRRVANGPDWMAGPGTSGDFKPEERAEYQPAIEQRRDRLLTRLKKLGAA
jgi:hypothetical protein